MVKIIKATGEEERFNKQKIIRSSMNAGATRTLAQNIAERVAKEIQEGTRSKTIHNKVAKMLEKDLRTVCRYKLKHSVMELGPSGFPFEQFFARILEEQGYTTQVGKTLQGNATTHEVDIIAKRKRTHMIECKFHNKQDIRTDTKEAMYTYARYLDLKNNKANKITNGWLVTNTKITSHAKEYAQGVGLDTTTWNHSTNGEGLQNMIEQKALYPITVFKEVRGKTKEKLVKEGYIFAKDLLEKSVANISKKTGIQKRTIQKILEESKQICERK